MQINLVKSAEGRVLTLQQGYGWKELVFCALVAAPGPLIYAYLADTHLWGILSLLAFGYLSASFLPPTAAVTVLLPPIDPPAKPAPGGAPPPAEPTTPAEITFTVRDSPFSSPHVYVAQTADITQVCMRPVAAKEISKQLAGRQLLVMFREGYGIPTTETLSVGDTAVKALRDAGVALAGFVGVPFVEYDEDPAADPKDKAKDAAAAGGRPKFNPATTQDKVDDEESEAESADVKKSK
ncbi:hypothetical protein H9P43_009875 [Blastocladiella emersonii ATCC 22665]|nr:hypothetical protein H9P43_009875 [Blastocladiella emersonii ATCC 22665]